MPLVLLARFLVVGPPSEGNNQVFRTFDFSIRIYLGHGPVGAAISRMPCVTVLEKDQGSACEFVIRGKPQQCTVQPAKTWGKSVACHSAKRCCNETWTRGACSGQMCCGQKTSLLGMRLGCITMVRPCSWFGFFWFPFSAALKMPPMVLTGSLGSPRSGRRARRTQRPGS